VAKNPHCENCMTHCGYEPTAALGLNSRPGDTWKNIIFNFGPRPNPKGKVVLSEVFNGASATSKTPVQNPELVRE